MECCEASYNMLMDPRANSYCINQHTSSKQESVPTGSGNMPASYSMSTSKAEDEYISTPHMPPWCGEGKPYLYLHFRPHYPHQDFETYYDNIPQTRTKTGTNPTATSSEYILSRQLQARKRQ
jgi:hypothetical protein